MSSRASSFDRQALLDCAHGKLFGPGNAQLPLPPMLMMDRVVEISADGGKHSAGFLRAEFDIHPDLWFFACHFEADPVMPGSLGVDALWQLVGFYLGWLGLPGKGRALGAGKVAFSGQVKPSLRLVTYEVDIRRVISRRLVMGIGEGRLLADGKPIYQTDDLRVGLFDPKDLA